MAKMWCTGKENASGIWNGLVLLEKHIRIYWRAHPKCGEVSYALIVYFVCSTDTLLSHLYTCWVDDLQMQAGSWDERILIQYNQRRNECLIYNSNTQQSTSTLRLGVNNNPMQQYSIILAKNWSLDVYKESTQRIELRNNDNSQFWD